MRAPFLFLISVAGPWGSLKILIEKMSIVGFSKDIWIEICLCLDWEELKTLCLVCKSLRNLINMKELRKKYFPSFSAICLNPPPCDFQVVLMGPKGSGKRALAASIQCKMFCTIFEDGKIFDI